MNRVIYALAGPTASGKTLLSISVAKKINAEIISVDSSLIYKKMNIGTAKPTLKEQDGVKHHLIDIIDPTEKFSVANFISHVNKLKNQIWSRGKEILLVGGSMLYFKSLIEGLSLLPESKIEIRKMLNYKKKEKGLEFLYKKLNKIDPESAEKINYNDQQRIFRFLEVIIISGKKYSELIKVSKTSALNEEIKLCALVPDNRFNLHKNIEFRFRYMLKQGFLNEVENLRKDPDLSLDYSSMKSVGYRQAWQYLNGDIMYNDFCDKSIIATRQLAKRQLTWIRNWKNTIKIFTMESKTKELEIINYFGY